MTHSHDLERRIGERRFRLAWIGNLGNVGFNCVKLLREQGLEAELYLSRDRLRRPGPGNPENEYPGAGAEPFVRRHHRDYLNFALNRLGLIGPPSPLERRIGRGYDLVQAQTCREISALRIRRGWGLPYAGMCTGADLSEVAGEGSPFARLYRRALEEAAHLFLLNIDQFRTVERLGLRLKSCSFLPFQLGVERFRERENPVGDRLVFFAAARLDWSAAGRASVKRNDIFLRGFAEFARESGREDLRLLIADWGVDRERTRELVAELGIGRLVEFVPTGDKQAFRRRLESCQVVVDQFGLGATGLTTVEAMACSRPVFAWCDQELARRAYGEELPVINCRTPEEVRRELERLTPARLAELSGRAYRWVSHHHHPERIARLLRESYGKILDDSGAGRN